MENVTIVGCGAYMDSGYGCTGEWRCLKAAALGGGNFGSPAHVMALVKCEWPGRGLISNVETAIKSLEVTIEVIYLSSCFANATPACPFTNAREIAEILENKTGIQVFPGTHNYF